MLSRRAGETIVTDGPAVITVFRIEGNKCRIGVLADDSVTVHRGEVMEAIRAEQEAARRAENARWVYAAPGMEVTPVAA